MIDIVMAYRDRLDQLRITLDTISQSSKKDSARIIIVDDHSSSANKAAIVQNEYDLNIEILDLSGRDRWWKNPCAVYNYGFELVQNDIVIIQNPECFHMGDIINYAIENSSDQKYISFPCYSISKDITTAINASPKKEIGQDFLRKKISPISNKPSKSPNGCGWFNHSKYHIRPYHYCSVISKKNLMDELHGFDNRFAEGYCFDDDEFLCRIKRLGLDVIIPDQDIFCVHQHHSHLISRSNKQWSILYFQNSTLFNKMKRTGRARKNRLRSSNKVIMKRRILRNANNRNRNRH